jgi:hypothetical protein
MFSLLASFTEIELLKHPWKGDAHAKDFKTYPSPREYGECCRPGDYGFTPEELGKR